MAGPLRIRHPAKACTHTRTEGVAGDRYDHGAVTTASPTGIPSDPSSPIDLILAEVLAEVLFDSTVEMSYSPMGTAPEVPARALGTASATAPGPGDWQTSLTIRLPERVAHVLRLHGARSLSELLDVMPEAVLRTAAQLRNGSPQNGSPSPAARRVARDTVAAEILNSYMRSRVGVEEPGELMAEVIEYLIELSGARIEAKELTHGVVIADALADTPRIELRYPSDLRPAKRAPLLFDGHRSVLVVDPHGRARTEVQRHRLDHDEAPPGGTAWSLDVGLANQSLVADASRMLGGIGFLVRRDRSIWTFIDGLPLLVRRAEHWTAFPVALTASIADLTDGAPAASLVARTAFLASTQPGGAILAIVDDPGDLAGVVPLKDRYDLRNRIDPSAMRPETRLHHLLDTDDLDEFTLARIASLDGATVLDRSGQLLAYAPVVTSSDSEHEGARTAAARTLSHSARVVLKISVDGDITIFQDGSEVATLLGRSTLGSH